MILFKTVLFTIFVPGTVVGLVPYLLATRGPELIEIRLGFVRYLGIIPLVAGVSFYLSSAWNFVARGKGTPAPIEPPRLLVTSGLYRIVRNPMYLGGILVLIGESLLFESLLVLCYLLIIWTVFHLFVIFYEEPHLRKIFGAAYEEYCRTVPRWIPDVPRYF